MHPRCGSEARRGSGELAILHEDRDLLVVDKPAGLLTIATDTERSRTAYYMLTDYVRKGNPKSRARVFIVHRLDRETSGVLVLAKSEAMKRRLQEGWSATRKVYLAVVHGHPVKKTDTIATYLAENKARVVYSTTDPARGKPARTAYRVLRESRDFSLLEVDLLTGRKNQIRVHLAGIGHPVVGDKKYGNGNDGHARLALHAWSIAFPHPFSGRPVAFSAEPPAIFGRLAGPIPGAAPAARRIP
jgi:tRNA pseudouridine32 synthase/23S rRNA pseudouridine746 synthase/23S rRNA pseudouridine1911/1915/1917 synthase